MGTFTDIFYAVKRPPEYQVRAQHQLYFPLIMSTTCSKKGISSRKQKDNHSAERMKPNRVDQAKAESLLVERMSLENESKAKVS